MKTNIYIDGANLHKGSKELGFDIDYKKFIGWLKQKYNTNKVYLFLGLIPKNAKLYERLQEFGYILIFKQTISNSKGEVKGNCDAELVLKVCNDFYEKEIKDFILITGDGDFGCLVNFLIESNSKTLILSPNKKKCSILLKRTKSKITDLNDHYHKFTK